MSEWKEYRFSEFVNINPSVTLKADQEYSFVEMKDLENGNKYCTPKIKKRKGGGAKFQNGDTLFARITPCLENGKICQVKELVDNLGFGSTEFYVFRGKQGISDTEFVYYLSRWDDVREHAEINLDGTSGRQRVPKACFDDLVISMPPLPEQSAIASILSSLDDKIDLLHRQNATLEKMAETLFRQWFVEEGKDEWEVGKLGDFVKTNVATVGRGYSYEDIEYLDTSSLTKGLISNLQLLNIKEAPSRAKRLVQHNDILISTVRPDQKHYGIIKDPKPNLVVSTGFCVVTCKSIGPHFVYLLLTSNEMTDYLHSIAEGSTSTYPSLKPSDIEKTEFQIPPKESLGIFEKLAEIHFKKINQNQTQIHTLTALRDTLLPKLMSGEIRTEM